MGYGTSIGVWCRAFRPASQFGNEVRAQLLPRARPLLRRTSFGQRRPVPLTTGGHSSNCGSASAISYQGALDPTKMCSPGRTRGSPSTIPNITSVIFPESVRTSGEPHFLQKHLARPGEDSYPSTNSTPDVHRNWSGLTLAHVA